MDRARLKGRIHALVDATGDRKLKDLLVKNGNLDRLADNALADPPVAEGLMKLDPRDRATVRAFARQARALLRERGYLPPPVRRIPDVEQKRGEFALVYLYVSALRDARDGLLEAVFALDAYLERNRLEPDPELGRALERLAPLVKAGDHGARAVVAFAATLQVRGLNPAEAPSWAEVYADMRDRGLLPS